MNNFKKLLIRVLIYAIAFTIIALISLGFCYILALVISKLLFVPLCRVLVLKVWGTIMAMSYILSVLRIFKGGNFDETDEN